MDRWSQVQGLMGGGGERGCSALRVALAAGLLPARQPRSGHKGRRPDGPWVLTCRGSGTCRRPALFRRREDGEIPSSPDEDSSLPFGNRSLQVKPRQHRPHEVWPSWAWPEELGKC